jgi:hypothetical protein
MEDECSTVWGYIEARTCLLVIGDWPNGSILSIRLNNIPGLLVDLDFGRRNSRWEIDAVYECASPVICGGDRVLDTLVEALHFSFCPLAVALTSTTHTVAL